MTPRRLIARLRHLRRSERGNGTIEFVIMLPVMLGLFMSTFELGMLLSRQVMLERGMDLAVRQVRIGAMFPVDHDTLKAEICEGALILPDCTDELKLEMQVVNPRAWAPLSPDADCVDREDPAQPPRTFTPGVRNQLMVLRACALFDPYFPTTGLGAQIPKHPGSGGAYALVAFSSYVVEPN